MMIRCAITLMLMMIPLAAQADSVSDRLNEFLASESETVVGVWVRFADKDLRGENQQAALDRQSQRLSEKTLARRSLSSMRPSIVVSHRSKCSWPIDVEG